MTDLDRYLRSEFWDAEYQDYHLKTQGPFLATLPWRSLLAVGVLCLFMAISLYWNP